MRDDKYYAALLEIQELVKGFVMPQSAALKQAEEMVTIFDGVPVKVLRKLEKIGQIAYRALQEGNEDDDAASAIEAVQNAHDAY
jgi:hypothetical protein